MRILVCAHQPPTPPLNGFRLALQALLEELRTRHDVRVLAAGTPGRPGEAVPPDLRVVARPTGIRSAPRSLRGTAGFRPRHVHGLAAALRGPLREELEAFEPDVVHVTPGALAGLARELEGRRSVLAALDAGHLNVAARARAASGLRRGLLLAEERRVRRFARSHFRRFAQVVVVSEDDRRELLALDPHLDIAVVPNGVNADDYRRDPAIPREPALLLFTGVLGYAPNVTAARFLAREVLPLVTREVPEARLALVGRAPSPAVVELAEPGVVEVTGEVPSLRPWLSRGSVYVCPMLSGTGIKNKLLEAMAAELPCVVTPLARQGLTAEPGAHLLEGRSAAELSARTVELLRDPKLAERLGRRAREYVVEHHDWRSVGEAYERIYRRALELEPGSAPTGGG